MLAILLMGLATVSLADVQISEVMAVNDTILQDEDLEYSDWIELYNSGGSAVDLTGWYLTDSKSDLTKWTFPTTNIPAGGFLIVFASGKNKTATELHTNFKLSDSGEYVALVHPDGTNVEHELRGVPEQFPDISYGIQTHGTNPTLRSGEAGYLIYHTPGTSNTCLPALHPLYSEDSVARIDLMISDADWQWLHWSSPDTTTFRSVDVRFRHGDIDITVTNVGIQCRGNTSLTEYPRNFNVAFNAFVPGQRMLDLERLNLNANVHEPSGARPKLVKDLHHAADLPIPYGNHVALMVSNTTYHYSYFDAVRNNTQPVDDVLLKQRFGTANGNLYKCLYMYGTPADLTYRGSTGTSYTSVPDTYKLRYCGSGDTSFDDFADFVSLITQTSDTDFPNAIVEAFDLDNFLKQMALDVLTANWDSYWGNANNYHLFYNPNSHRWSYIPYDFDNVCGISWDYASVNWATFDIYDYPQLYTNTPLVHRIMDVPEFRKRYAYYMKEMVDDFFITSDISNSIYQTRSILTNSLAFGGSVTNIKAEDRSNYSGDNPYWSYDNFFWSYQYAQWEWNDNLKYTSYRDWGITDFVSTKRSSVLSQLGTLSNIAPVLSDFDMDPALPRTNDEIEVSIEGFDDSAITNVSFIYSFDGGATQTVEMALQPDGSYETNIPAFGSAGTLTYYVRATDDDGTSTTHPYGGSDYAATVDIESDSLNILFSEIHYHPLDPSSAEIAAGFEEEDFEFVEISNVGDSPMDLTGFTIQDGITAVLPSETLTNGEYAVIVANTNAFRTRYTNEAIRILCIFDGKLSNSGETLRLEDGQGGKIVEVEYSDSGSWPGRADGDGSSLEVEDLYQDITDADNWRSSSEIGGTPGTAGLGPDNRIVINEVLTHTDPPLCDTIELYNTTDTAIDISGWALTDATTNFVKFVIPTGTVLSAYSYVSYNESNDFNTSWGVASNDFALDGAHGDDVFLIETDANGNPYRIVDRVEFGAAINAESFGRWPNGSGRLVPMSSRTFSASNSGPRVGPVLINEIMYNPANSNDSLEFIEIYNSSALAVDLTRWELDGGVDYTFASNSTLAAGETLVIIPFNPDNPSNSTRLATFRTTYGLSTNVPLVGGYDGWLDNGGERLRLLYPDEPPAEETNYYPMLLMDETRYDDEGSWPIAADGGGASLSRQGTDGWGDDASSWAATIPPTPGSNPPPVETCNLIVFSDHGSPIPGAGTNGIASNSTFTASVTSPDIAGGNRFICTGWTLDGLSPASGSSNSFSLTLANDATLHWLWTTNYSLSVSAQSGGQVSSTGGWHTVGTQAGLTATPSNGYLFAGWTGDTNAITTGTAGSTSITVTINLPVSLTAEFEAIVPTYYVSPSGSSTAPYTNWTMAATSIQTAVDYAPANSTVLVASATYSLSSQLTLGKAIHLLSADGPATTILDGGNSTRVLLLTNAAAVMEGFTIQNADSSSSSGGGVRIDPDGLLSHCIVRGCTTEKSGGGCAVVGDGTLRNCLFYDNSADLLGGGIYTYTESGTPLIQSCTVTENSADNGGGGLYLLNAATLQNSIVWGNTSAWGNSNLYLENSGHTIVFTDSGPAQSGTSNTGVDPVFVDASSNNFRIAPTSPLVNAGTSQSWMAGATDLDGYPRMLYGTNDMGAYEGLISTVDSDNDRVEDWQESLAGTDPFDADSVLGIQNAQKDSVPGQFVMNWSSTSNRSYRITFATNMLPPAVFSQLAYSNIPATPPANTFTGVLTQPGAAYYRIEVE